MDKKAEVTRREFLKETALAGANAAVLGGFAPVRVLGANDRIRVGVLGSGHRARYVMELFKKVPGVEFVAVCDVLAAPAPKLWKLPDWRRGIPNYHEVLDRKDIDAVLIGSPDHWHKQMLIDALAAGKDAYVEKPIMHSIEQGEEMVRAVDASQRIVQTGTRQRHLGPLEVRQGNRRFRAAGQGHHGSYLLVSEIRAAKKSANHRPGGPGLEEFLGDAPDQPFSEEKFRGGAGFGISAGGFSPTC